MHIADILKSKMLESLSSREQSLIAVAAAIGLSIFAWYFVINPVLNYREQGKRKLELAQQDLATVQKLLPIADQLQPGSNVLKMDAFYAAVAGFSLNFSAIQTNENGVINLSIDRVESRHFITFLDWLFSQPSIEIVSITVSQLDQDFVVVRLSLNGIAQ